MCFKGSARRNAEQVNLDFDRIGSEYNAFTSEEATFYYIFAVRSEQESALDQMADLMRPALRLEDFTMEKNVILEEIAMYLDHIEMMAGNLPQKERRFVEAWAEIHQAELLAAWERLQAGRSPGKIEPLR